MKAGRLIGVVAVLGALAAAPVPKHLLPKEEPFLFPTSVGTTWVYEMGDKSTITVVLAKVEDEKDGQRLVLEEEVANGPRKHYMTYSLRPTGLFLVAENGRPHEGSLCVLKFPPKAGDIWEFAPGQRQTHGPERVQAGFGKVEAFRVEWELRPGDTATYWFASGMGLVRRETNPG
ncbi:MAG: hypothetical protein K2V38_27855, partial [Gemmataceae bacterium]|nr:hypothetical protein [Gemmataceae bacterium]